MTRITFLFLATATFLASCTSEDSVTEIATDIDITEVEDIMSTDNWYISSFIDSDKDETSDFAGYEFSFNDDGSVVATKGTTSITGTWSISHSDDDDDSSSDPDFNLFFAGNDLFEDLNDDWDIINYSPVKIELIDISGGNGGTDYLTFKK